MDNIITLQCLDLTLFLDKEKKVCCDFTCCDSESEKMTNIVVPIYQQLGDIYGNMEITKTFLKRLEYKLKLTVRLHETNLTFVIKDGEYFLQTQFKDIYEPVTLTYYGVKMGDNPLTIDVNIIKLFFYKKKILLEFSIKEIDEDSNELVEKVRRINVYNDMISIYTDNKVKERFKNKLNIQSKKRQVFFESLFEYLEGKTVSIEYDEHKGYTLWTSLEDFADNHEKKK